MAAAKSRRPRVQMVLLSRGQGLAGSLASQSLQPRELGPTCSAPAPHSGHHHHHAGLQTRWQSEVGVGCMPPLTIAHYGRLGRNMLSQWHLEYLENLVITQNRYLPPVMQILPSPLKRYQHSLIWHLWPLLIWVCLLP